MHSLVDDIVVKQHVGTLEYTPKDFKAGIDVRWCAGCGGYSILAQTQRVVATLGIPREKLAFISGIGCSSRFPYYMNVYGVHSMHGRALPIASGLKTARPDLSIWVATGDGDCMSIGGNHLIHACRRNINLNVMMFNNEVYSLTKGQYSPTSQPGQITKSSPLGVLDNPFNPAALVLGSGASFVARTIDGDGKHMQYLMERAAKHNGFSFIEIYTNCPIFNDGAFDFFAQKSLRSDKTIVLEHGKPMIFGTNNDKGIKLDGFTPTVVSLSDGSNSADDLLVHNEKDTTLAFILANMTYHHELPRPMGIFQAIDIKTYEDATTAQIEHYTSLPDAYDYDKLLRGEDCWEIE
ncbi:MAG: 2-oxoacid:ferredoxin oxidoreductase subunit beta [Candidatus Kapabacteria bacterium]|nr:2-oxoacid:ferredoxin oxidoreductase subunit beta [Candidatus Kapabacteria bacterium]